MGDITWPSRREAAGDLNGCFGRGASYPRTWPSRREAAGDLNATVKTSHDALIVAVSS